MDLRICLPRGLLPPEIHGLHGLKQALNDDWLAYANFYLPLGNAEEAEIDVALFGPGGVWIIDLKHWRGKVISRKNSWTQIIGKFQRSHGFSAARKIKGHAPKFARFVTSALSREP